MNTALGPCFVVMSFKTEENQEQEENCQESQDMKMELSFEKR